MLSIKLIKAGSENYYLDLAAEDYYFNGGEPPGKWIGSGCHFFGLEKDKTIQKEKFRRIFNGYHPELDPDDAAGKLALVQNVGKENRRSAWDLCFSAPKSVSIIWSQASDEMQRRIQDLHHQAITKTFSFVEERLAYSRTGSGGSGAVQAKLVAAVFEHGTSRARDPQLHSHTVVMNIGVNESYDEEDQQQGSDGARTSPEKKVKIRSIEPKPLYKNKMLLGAIYRSHLAHMLHDEFGFNALRKGNCFEIQGVPKERIEDASKRRKQILRRLHEQGKSGAVAAAQAAVETREKKKHIARKTLIEEWREANEKFGFDDATLEALVCPVETNYRRHIPKIRKTAFENLTRRLSHFTAHDFYKEVLYAAPEYGVSPDDLEGAVTEFLSTSPQVIPIPTTDGSSRFVAKSVLEQELALLKQLKRLHARQGLQVSDATLIKVLGRNDLLNHEQRQAVRHLTQGTAAIRVVQGYAGTGKTTMLRTAVEGWKASGFNVVGACFTGAAAEVLEEEIGVPCDTINMTLADFNSDLKDTLVRWGKHSFKQFVRIAAGKKKTYAYKRPKPVDINRHTIILVDEAGSVNVRHMEMLTKWANDNNATLVLTGDEAQTPAVEGGSPLHSITRRIGCTMMTDIKRQQDYWACSAAHHLARGEIAKALHLFDERGLLKVDDDIEEALQRLVRDWYAHAFDCLHQSRIVTLTNDLARHANQLAQQMLLDRKILNAESWHKIYDLDEESGTTYESRVHLGDRILFTKTNRTYGIKNGQAGTVLGFTLTTKERPQRALKVRLDSGRIVRVPLGFRHIRLGYASTVQKAQGNTYDEVFVLLGGGAQNLPISYVQGTRSKWATHFYTERALYDQIQDIAESPLVSQMEREVDLSLAVDLFVQPTAAAATQDELIEKLLNDCKAKMTEEESSLVLTKDENLAEQVNAAIHKHRYAMAQTEWDKWRLADPNERGRTEMPTFTTDDHTLVVGDRLRFLQDGGPLKAIHKHELGTVTEIKPETQTLQVELDRGETVRMAMDSVPKHVHGYAVTHEQADQGSYKVKDAYLLQPETFRSTAMNPAYSTDIDYFKWNPQSTQTQSVFSSGTYTLPGTQYSFQSANAHTYSTTPQYTQMAADWHQKAYALNQSSSFQHAQADYSQSYTQSHYQQSF